MKQCFTWWSFANRGVEADALLRGAREIGYTGVELLSPDLFDRARDHGLEIVTHGGHASISSGLNDPAQHDRIEREVEASLDLASRFGIGKLIVFSGNRRPDQSDAAGQEQTIIGLRRLAPLAESAGVTLVLELLNSKVDHAGYQCDGSAWACDIVRAVDSPSVRILFDIYHAQVMEGDLIRTIERNGACFGHYHTAGNPGRHELDEKQEIYYPAVFRAIARTGYRDYIGHEFIPTGPPLASLRHTYDLVNAALAI